MREIRPLRSAFGGGRPVRIPKALRVSSLGALVIGLAWGLPTAAEASPAIRSPMGVAARGPVHGGFDSLSAGSVGAVLTLAARFEDPRKEMMKALSSARDQFSALELEAALATLDAAVARARAAGMGTDPALAPLLVLRGGIIYSTTGDQSRTSQAFDEAVAADYNAVLPIELRSEELTALLDAARSSRQPPEVAVTHEAPKLYAGQDVVIEALSGVPLQDGAQLTLYYRSKGSTAEFTPVYMELYGNLGVTTVTAAEHADKGLEYFFYVYDANDEPLGNYGNQETPLLLELAAGTAPPGPAAGGSGGEDGEAGKDKPSKPSKPRGKSTLPRVFINLGLGTGVGLARGTADLTYQQYTPAKIGAAYSAPEQACAIERWFVADGDVAGDPFEFATHLQDLETQPVVEILPRPASELQGAYDAAYCGQRHPVSTGMASAPLHLAPEVGFRIGRAFVLSVFSRLQVVTGSKVFVADPDKGVGESFTQDVTSPKPRGVRIKPPFTFAVGVKGKYFFGRDDAKLRLYAGGFAGYGTARLRVDMKFANDRNGNSVPDSGETAISGPRDGNDMVILDQCTPVWPYNRGCLDDETGETARDLADTVAKGTPGSDSRVDTVVIGPGFAGLLFGAHFQIVKNFAIYGEINAGGWFPAAGSILFDLNLGPVITF